MDENLDLNGGVTEPEKDSTPEPEENVIDTEDALSEPDEAPSAEYAYTWSEEAALEVEDKAQKPSFAPAKPYRVAVICLSVLCISLMSVLVFLLIGNSSMSGGMTTSQIAERGSEFTVAIQANKTTGIGTGTGIILTDNGYIATNYHVISDAQSVTVYTHNGQEYSGTVIATKPECDIALLRINAHAGERFKYAQIGEYSAVRAGDAVVAIGTPYNISYAWSVSSGCISNVKREVMVDSSNSSSVTMMQTDAAANPGNSGGPLINDKGQVIGIVSARLGVDGYENINFAIPISEHMDFFNAGINSDMSKPQIGITGVALKENVEYYIHKEEKKAYSVFEDDAGTKYIIINSRYEQELTDEYMAKGFLITPEKSGILIFGVSENADANGKLREGDLVTKFDGIELVYDDVTSPFDTVRDILGQKTSKDTVSVTFTRNGEEYEVRISLKEKE